MPASDLQVPSGWSATLTLSRLWKGCPLSAHDQQTLCDISLLVWRFTSASASQGVSLS